MIANMNEQEKVHSESCYKIWMIVEPKYAVLAMSTLQNVDERSCKNVLEFENYDNRKVRE